MVNISAFILIIFMLQFTYAKGLYMSSVDAYQESCLGTVVNMSTLRSTLTSWNCMNVYHLWEEWAKCSSQLQLSIGTVKSLDIWY